MAVGLVRPRAVRRPRAGEGHSGLVPYPQRGAPELEKAAASNNRDGEGEWWGTPRRLCELGNVVVFF